MRALLLSVALLALTVAPATAAPDPLGCTGYPEARVFMESQTWWLRTPGKTGTDFGHVHLGACMPSEQVVRGTVGLDIRVIMHASHGATFDRIEPVAKTDSQETTLGSYTSLRGLTTDTGTVTGWQHIDIDTTRYGLDGRQELRLRAWAKTPDGNLMHVSLNTLWDVRNGKTVNPLDRLPIQRFKGWYSDPVGYCEARITSKVTPAPVSGTWTVDVAWPNHDASLPITRRIASLDADAHAGIPGTVLVDAAGPGTATLSIDTRTLSDGPHRLALRSDCDVTSGSLAGSTNSGVGVVVFVVRNGTPVPTPAPTPVPTPVPTPSACS